MNIFKSIIIDKNLATRFNHKTQESSRSFADFTVLGGKPNMREVLANVSRDGERWDAVKKF